MNFLFVPRFFILLPASAIIKFKFNKSEPFKAPHNKINFGQQANALSASSRHCRCCCSCCCARLRAKGLRWSLLWYATTGPNQPPHYDLSRFLSFRQRCSPPFAQATFTSGIGKGAALKCCRQCSHNMCMKGMCMKGPCPSFSSFNNDSTSSDLARCLGV